VGPKNSKAVTCTEHKKVYFDCGSVNHKDNVAVHELVHVYSYELLGHDISIASPGDHEEYFASLFERRGQEMLDKAKPVTKELHKRAKQWEKRKKKEKKQHDESDDE
jgi:hypothetical protein